MGGKGREFGGLNHGDDQAALLNPGNKPLTQIVQDDSFREFEFRQYLFACQSKDEMLYEVNANSENWMIAGRKRGHVSLATKQGSRIVISLLCMPLVAGYVHPPHLGLPDIDEASISCSPAGPHLVCVLPPPLSSSFCISA